METDSKTTYQQCDGHRHAKSIDLPEALLIWWRTRKTSFNSSRKICRQRRSLLRTSQNENACESVIAKTKKRYWCLTYGVVLNGFCCNLTNQIPQVSFWIAQRHNDQKHQNKDNLQVTQGVRKHCVSFANKTWSEQKVGRAHSPSTQTSPAVGEI